jgi:hypothetical protein
VAEFVPSGPFSRKSAENLEKIPGRLFGMLGRFGQYLGSEKAAKDYTNLLRGMPASAAAENPLAGDPTGRYIPVKRQRSWEGEVPGAPPPLQLPPPGFGAAPIVYGSNGSGGADRRKSDVYKQYAMTPEGQFQRYFSTGEMDPFFGATSRGTGSPQTAAEMMTLAAKPSAPTEVPLSTYYRAQSAAGRAEMPTILETLGYGKGTPLAAWAEANPMLARRLYEKQLAKNPAESSPAAAEFGRRAQEEGGYAATMQATPSLFVGNPIPPTEDRSGTGMSQGEKMDISRGIQNLQPIQAAKTSGSSMPQFDTTDESLTNRINAFLYGK